MFEDLYECLELLNLTPNNVYHQIFKLNNKKIIEAINVLNSVIYTNNNDLSVQNSLFNFVACEDLSGGAQYCASIDCRLNKASEMANFASLYADTVLIIDPFEKYLKYTNLNETIRHSLANDILIIWYFSPLIKKGIIQFAQTEHHFCKNCLQYFSSKDYDNEEKVNKATKYIKKEFLDNVNIYFENDDKFGFLEIAGPEELVEHGRSYQHFTHYTPKELQKYQNSTRKEKLSKEIIARLGIMDYYTGVVIEDFAIQNWYTYNFDYSYLTNRDIDLKLIDQTNDNDISIKNRKLYDCLAHQLPIIKDTGIKEILKIREKDGESFILYRNNMRKLIKELPDNPLHIKEAFYDIVQPEIDKINISLNESKRSIPKNIARNVAITSGIIYIGLTSGILPNNIKEIVATAGGFGLVQSAVTNITEGLAKPKMIRENPYYFLWKANKKVK